jgi:hypothetical protein
LQEEVAQRLKVEAELAAAKKDHAKLYKAWEEGKDKNAKLTKMLVESKRMLPSFLPYPSAIRNYYSRNFSLSFLCRKNHQGQ